MTNITGGSGNDYIHPDDNTGPPPTYTDNPVHTGDGNDYIDVSQGGDDYVLAAGGNDTIFMGAAFDGNDTLDGGNDGIIDGENDILELAGNYYQRSVIIQGHPIVYDIQIAFQPNTITNIESIKLDDGSGFGYDLLLNANTISANSSLRIDGSGLFSAPFIVDASAALGNVAFLIGASPTTLTGAQGTGSSLEGAFFSFTSEPTTSQVVTGISALDVVSFNSALSDGVTIDAAHFNGIDAFDFQAGRNIVTVTNDAVAAGGIVSFIAGNAASLRLDGHLVAGGAFAVTGSEGDDTLIGGAQADTLDGGAGPSVLEGNGGDDFLLIDVDQFDSGQLDGGDGFDSATLNMAANFTLTLGAETLQNIERIYLQPSNLQSSDTYAVTLEDGVVGPSGALDIIDYLSAPATIDASAVVHGTLSFYIPSDNAGSHFIGGAGNDLFQFLDLTATSGTRAIVDGGGGSNTLTFLGSTDPLSINAATGIVTQPGKLGDVIHNFSIYEFGSGAATFVGASASETIRMGANLDAGDALNGGAGNDTVLIEGNYAAGLVFGSTTMVNVETLRLSHTAFSPVYSYVLTTADNTVAVGATLRVDGSALLTGGTLSFDGHAETNGHFNISGGLDADTMKGGALADTLSGGGGADSLTGGAGNDTYVVDNAADRVIEAANGGTDTVFASASYVLGSGQSIEWLSTTSQAGTAALSLTGNALSQTVNGNAGANRLDGGGGGDILSGHKGNDIYLVRSAADQVIEANGEGTDTVYATVSYTLGSGQSIDTLATASQTGTGALNLTGNNNANHIIGNNGNNIISGSGGVDLLFGYGGNDTIIGGAASDTIDTGNGRDVVRFNQLSDSTGVNRDVIYTMNLGATDKFDFPVVPTSIHAEVTTGSLSTATFDHDLAAAIHTSSQLGAHQAVLFDPDGGDLNVAGHVFLIVDVNGQAGYQAGADYVVELVNATGTLTTDDFV